MEIESAKVIAAAIAAGVGGIGAGIGEGILASKAMEAIGRNPEIQEKITPLLFITMAIVESTSIYGLVVALIILFG
ncbi:MAG: ATP synthase F0 subunit C [Parcubacteria group bacterium]|nr:ATP synthase F0 subunit C [Parcubacteria group bacterium]